MLMAMKGLMVMAMMDAVTKAYQVILRSLSLVCWVAFRIASINSTTLPRMFEILVVQTNSLCNKKVSGDGHSYGHVDDDSNESVVVMAVWVLVGVTRC